MSFQINGIIILFRCFFYHSVHRNVFVEDDRVACYQCGGGWGNPNSYSPTEECIDHINRGNDELCGGNQCYVSKKQDIGPVLGHNHYNRP